MEENVCEKFAVNLDFTENGNFIRVSTEAAGRGCSGTNAPEKTRGGVLI